MNAKQIILVAFVALLAGAGLQLINRESGPDLQKMAVEAAELNLAEWQLPDLNQQPQAISQWQGEVLVVNYWATWCPPCRREIPALQQLQAEYGQYGVRVIGVAVDRAEAVAQFVAEQKMDYDILLDPSGSSGKQLGNKFGSLPFTVVIDRELNAGNQHLGEMDLQQMKALVGPYL